MRLIFLKLLALFAFASLAACGGGDTAAPAAATPLPTANPVTTVTAVIPVNTVTVAPPLPEETRPHDARTFTAVVTTSTFAPLTLSAVVTDRWTGVFNGSVYRIEVPQNWNGKLVMWTHGFRGTGASLTADNPIQRRYLVDNGYAWAASSYSKNYYDVKAGVEDTNALALNFTKLAADNGRTLAAPSKIFITGISMGGHIAVAAIEAEGQATAISKVKYNGAVPLCAVLGDNELFNYFAGYQVAAQQLANVPLTKFPTTDFATVAPLVRSALWSIFPTASNAQGDKLKNVVMNLSGGDRPFYKEGWSNEGQPRQYLVSTGG